ncbi:hypothetical protein BC830DRAFT_146275 [Chytriomyces sp. MP71]|nr:hypothetical protein BC830DRAFT_146275 [Chytriomyces sp. MP71]
MEVPPDTSKPFSMDDSSNSQFQLNEACVPSVIIENIILEPMKSDMEEKTIAIPDLKSYAKRKLGNHNDQAIANVHHFDGAGGKAFLSEKEAMRNVNYFSIKGLPLSHFRKLVKEWGGRDALRGLTTQDVCTKFIIPMTKASGLSLCAQYYFDPEESGHPALVQDADWFVSHAWSYQFLDVIAALNLFCMNEGFDSSTTYFWFDCMTVSQHQYGMATKTFDWWTTVFRHALQAIGNVVLVMLPWNDPTPLKRSWCLFEIFTANDTGSNFKIAMSKQEKEKFLSELFIGGASKYYDMLLKINMEKSEASCSTDRDHILALTQEKIGFRDLHQSVFHTISNWVIFTLQRQITVTKDLKEIVNLKSVLGNFYEMHGDHANAEPLYWQCLKAHKKLFGTEHPSTLVSLNNLANLYQVQEKYDEAESLYLQCLQTRKMILGKEHADTLNSINNLAEIYKCQVKYTDAEPLLVSCLQSRRKILGKDHNDTLMSMNNLAELYKLQGKEKLAEPLFLQCLSTRSKMLGKEHPDTLQSLNNLASLYVMQKKYRPAETLYQDCLEAHKKILGNEHPRTLQSMNSLANLYKCEGKYNQAESLFKDCLTFRKKILGNEHSDTLATMKDLEDLHKKYKKRHN